MKEETKFDHTAYQWQVKDGVARIVNRYHPDPPYNVDNPEDCERASLSRQNYNELEDIAAANIMHTNSPDGVYKGKEYKEVWQWMPSNGDEWLDVEKQDVDKFGTFESFTKHASPYRTHTRRFLEYIGTQPETSKEQSADQSADIIVRKYNSDCYPIQIFLGDYDYPLRISEAIQLTTGLLNILYGLDNLKGFDGEVEGFGFPSFKEQLISAKRAIKFLTNKPAKLTNTVQIEALQQENERLNRQLVMRDDEIESLEKYVRRLLAEKEQPEVDTYPGWQLQPLFDYMSEQHDVILLFDEMIEILNICREIDEQSNQSRIAELEAEIESLNRTINQLKNQ